MSDTSLDSLGLNPYQFDTYDEYESYAEALRLVIPFNDRIRDQPLRVFFRAVQEGSMMRGNEEFARAYMAEQRRQGRMDAFTHLRIPRNLYYDQGWRAFTQGSQFRFTKIPFPNVQFQPNCNYCAPAC